MWVLTPFIPLGLVLGWLEVDFLNPPWRIVKWFRALALRWRTRLMQIGALLEELRAEFAEVGEMVEISGAAPRPS